MAAVPMRYRRALLEGLKAMAGHWRALRSGVGNQLPRRGFDLRQDHGREELGAIGPICLKRTTPELSTTKPSGTP